MKRWCWVFVIALGLTLRPHNATGCYGPIYDTIHFTWNRPNYMAPPRPYNVESWGEPPDRRVGYPGNYLVDDDWDFRERFTLEVERKTALGMKRARNLETSGQFAQAADTYSGLLERKFGSREFLVEQIEFLRQADQFSRSAVDNYLLARACLATGQPIRAIGLLRNVYADKASREVRAFALYDLAGLAYDRSSQQAALVYRRAYHEYPKSTRAEAALIMAIRCELMGDGSYSEIDKGWKAEAIARARSTARELNRAYPASRFTRNAAGWMARADFLEGRVAAARTQYRALLATEKDANERCRLIESLATCSMADGDAATAFCWYLRMLAEAKDFDWHGVALATLNDVRDRLSGKQGQEVGAQIRKNPELLQPYLDFRLYHSHLDSETVGPILDMAQSVLAANPNAGLSPVISARLAEMELKRHRYAAAADYADRSLRTRKHQRFDLALYVRASAAHGLKNLPESIAYYERLVRECPRSYLVGGARENLAVLYEKRHDFVRALEQYFELEYETDVAFMLDVHMSIDEIRAYIRQHPRDKHGKLLEYSLGIRLLRDDRLDEAEKVLRAIPRADLLKFCGIVWTKDWATYEDEQVHNPLNVIKDLRYLEGQVESAGGKENRAKALFKLGNYFYDKRPLLLYNAALWDYGRSMLFTIYWDPSQHSAVELKAVSKHMYAHECLNRARLILERVANEFPDSSVAPQALYRAACAASHLENMNEWWRAEGAAKKLGLRAAHMMARMARQYPNSPLAPEARKYSKVFAGVVP